MQSQALLTALSLALGLVSTTNAGTVTPAEARAIAKEAYIYGFPVVDNYRIQYAYFVDASNPEYKAPWNQIRNQFGFRARAMSSFSANLSPELQQAVKDGARQGQGI